MDKNYEEGKNYGQNDIIELQRAWLNLYDQYFEKSDDTRFTRELRNKDENLKLLLQINIIESIVEHLEKLDESKDHIPHDVYLNSIASLGNSLKKVDRHIKFESAEPIKPQLARINAVKGGLQTRYELLLKKDLNVEKADIMLYYEIKAHIEQTLDRNLPEVINMLQWIAYEKLYKKKKEYVSKQHSREGPS